MNDVPALKSSPPLQCVASASPASPAGRSATPGNPPNLPPAPGMFGMCTMPPAVEEVYQTSAQGRTPPMCASTPAAPVVTATDLQHTRAYNFSDFYNHLEGLLKLSHGGRLPGDSVRNLVKETELLPKNSKEKLAAQEILWFLFDSELDAGESEEILKQIQRAVGKNNPLYARAAEFFKNLSDPVASPLIGVPISRIAPPSNALVSHYDLDWTPIRGEGLKGSTTLTVRMDSKSPFLILEAQDLKDVSAELKGSPPVKLQSEVIGNRLYVKLPPSLQSDQNFCLKINYQTDYTIYKSKLCDHNPFCGYGVNYTDEHRNNFATLTWPYFTGRLFPSNSAPSARSTFTIRIHNTHPGEDLYEASGTPVTGITGKPTDPEQVYEITTRVPAYLVALYGAQKKENHPHVVSETGYDGSKYTVYFPPAWQCKADEAEVDYHKPLEVLDKMRKYIEDKLGLPLPKNQKAYVDLSGVGLEGEGEFSFAMNDQKWVLPIFAHEPIHFLYGSHSSIPKHSGEVWLAEGPAEYLSIKALDDQKITPANSLKDHRDALAAEDPWREFPLHAPSTCDPQRVRGLEVFFPYALGSWVFRVMDVHLGEKIVFGILRGWAERTKDQNVTTEDCIKYLESLDPEVQGRFQKSTGLTFREFFVFLNTRPRLPRLALQERIDASGKVWLKLEAKDNGLPPKLFTVPIVIRDASGNLLTSFNLPPGQEMQIDPSGRIEVDPDVTVLAAIDKTGLIDETCLTESSPECVEAYKKLQKTK